MTDRTKMRAAIPHIERAQRSLEMLRLFAENKGKLGLTRRVPQYYNSLIESVIELQKLLLSDSEYADLVSDNIHHVSKSREFVYDVTTNPKGEMFFSLDALLPLKRMKRRVLVGRGRAAPMIGGHRV